MSQNDGRLVYTKVGESSYLVGTNESTNWGNGAVEGREINGTVTIPDEFNGLPVIEVGVYAFCQCRNIEHIIIGKYVVMIGKYAFGDLPNVTTVYIPSSVRFIQESGILFYHNKETKLSTGKVQIYIEENSQLEYINSTFGWKQEVQIFSPSIVTPQCSGLMFDSVKKVIIYSPYEFHFCGIKSFLMKTFETSFIDLTSLFIYCSIIFVINN